MFSRFHVSFLIIFLIANSINSQINGRELDKKIDLIYELSETDYKESIVASKKLLSEVDKYSDDAVKARIYVVTSNVMLFNGDVSTCIENLKKAISLIEGKDEDSLYLHANWILAKAYVETYNYENAFQIYTNLIVADEYISTSDKHFFKWGTLGDFAHLNSLIGRKDQALRLYVKSFELAKDSINIAHWQKVALNIADLYNFFGKKDSAQIYFNKYQRLSDRYKPTLVEDFLPKYRGNLAFYDKNYKEAIREYEIYEQLLSADFDVKDGEVLIRKSRSYVEIEQLDSASVVLQEIKDMDNFTRMEAYLDPDFYRIYYDIYLKQGELQVASNYLEKYDQAQERYNKFAFNKVDELYKLKTKETEINEKGQKSKLQLYINYLLFALGTLCIVFIVVFTIKQRREKKKFEALMQRTENNPPLNTSLEPSINTTEIKDEKVAALVHQIKELQEQGFFLKQKTTLYNTAKKLKTNTSYLSTVINNNMGTTFSAFVNDIRMDYIINELKPNKQLRSYSVKAIAEEIGYKSADSFSKYFKQSTGLSPSSYIKKLNKDR
ncbi:helix-turn-helix domain-containing protein [Maribacter sp. 1_2014MBL_MicDiv]|uniref:helix-turn-helix domain-containing protein n=1 Tax=Maribacter sp. 1_2014MBL_MicDiv TaxID=1644130 RepID=UPI000AAEE1F9|nr:helix-turn-helix domain-containing protein [Maribacter sp. 1_2014MBL_MicDiv]